MAFVNASELDSLSDHPALAAYDKEPMSERYVAFREDEGIPVHTGFYVEDIYELETGPWDRTGERGALINLYGMEGYVDLHLHELSPGGETSTQRHFYQEIVYVMEGRGATTIGVGGDEVSFEWSKGAVFALPKNVPYRHVNLSGDSSAKLICQTDLPSVLDLVGDRDFVFGCDYDFWTRYRQDELYTKGETKRLQRQSGTILSWKSNFVPDIFTFDEIPKDTWESLGEMNIIRLMFPILNLDTTAHLSEIPVGRYKNAHRHMPGAIIFILSGEGYALMWKDGSDVKIRMDWGPGSIYIPAGGWYHHHFNVGAEPANQFAIHSTQVGTMAWNGGELDSHLSDNIIDYADEDPEIRELFERELAERGLEIQMPEYP